MLFDSHLTAPIHCEEPYAMLHFSKSWWRETKSQSTSGWGYFWAIFILCELFFKWQTVLVKRRKFLLLSLMKCHQFDWCFLKYKQAWQRPAHALQRETCGRWHAFSQERVFEGPPRLPYALLYWLKACEPLGFSLTAVLCRTSASEKEEEPLCNPVLGSKTFSEMSSQIVFWPILPGSLNLAFYSVT